MPSKNFSLEIFENDRLGDKNDFFRGKMFGFSLLVDF